MWNFFEIVQGLSSSKCLLSTLLTYTLTVRVLENQWFLFTIGVVTFLLCMHCYCILFFFTLEVVHLTVKSNKCCSQCVVSFYYRAYKITFWGSNTLLPLNVIAIKISQSWSNQQYWMLVSHLWCVARFSTIHTI